MADTGKTIGLIKALASVDPEAIKSSVDDWLDDHPEATTTVEDGAITKAKLDSSLQQTVDDVGDLKSAVDYPYGYTNIEQGGVDNNGKNNTSDVRIRTAGFIPVIGNAKIKLIYDTVAQFDAYASLSFYALNDFTASRLSVSDWVLSGAEATIPSDANYCRIIWKRGTGGSSSIVPTDIDNVSVVCKPSDIVDYIRSETSKIDTRYSVPIPVKVGTLNTNGIESTNTTTRLLSDGFLPVTPGSVITLSWDSDLTLQCSISFYAKADYTVNRITYINYGIEGTLITIPDGAKFARFIWRVGTAGTSALPLSSLTNVTAQPLPITDIVKSMFVDSRQYATGALFERIDLDLAYVGDLSMQQAFCKYNNKWYSTNGSGITVQSADLTVESSATLALGHGNAMHTGMAHPEYAYVSGWNDQKIYVVDLTDLTIKQTITLPTTGYTTAAVDDIHGIAYIFQRDSYPNTNAIYTFIAYDYVNEQILYTRKTSRSFGAMQACDIWQDKIIVVNGQGKASGITDYYLVYDRHGNITQEIFLPTLDGKEPEGVVIDRDTGDIWLGIQIQNGGQQLYKITRHTI